MLPKKLADSAAQFEALNIPVIVIYPETLDTFLETVEMLGKATRLLNVQMVEIITYTIP